ADTVVFWDVTDFPIHTGRSYIETLRSALVINGYTGRLKIKTYGEEKPNNLGDRVNFVRKRDKYARLNIMLLDISVWGVDLVRLPLIPRNVIVLAENIQATTNFVTVSWNMRSAGTKCIWVLPDDYEDEKIYHLGLPSAHIFWKWQDLLDGKKPMSEEDVRALRLKAPSDLHYYRIKNNVS
ncbi:unnamed protein product, partial [Eruca vesicaria subsp. sativa]|nr:unnamed protein product [Eruca vesicaria subsp. sativa]